MGVSKAKYVPSKPVLIAITVLAWLLINADFAHQRLMAHVLIFGLISVLLEGDYLLYVQKEEVEHGASGKH